MVIIRFKNIVTSGFPTWWLDRLPCLVWFMVCLVSCWWRAHLNWVRLGRSVAQCWHFNRSDGPLLGVNKHLISAGFHKNVEKFCVVRRTGRPSDVGWMVRWCCFFIDLSILLQWIPTLFYGVCGYTRTSRASIEVSCHLVTRRSRERLEWQVCITELLACLGQVSDSCSCYSVIEST